MSFYSNYLQKLIGGSVRIPRISLQPGHIVSFRYKDEKTNRKLNRIILVLGKFRKGQHLLVHGVTIENVPESKLSAFLKLVIIKDTLSLVKRKYELKGPFKQLIDRPKPFYTNWIKPNLMNYDCYRTYIYREMKMVKCYMLDWKKLKVFDNSVKKVAQISKSESLLEITKGREMLNKILGVDLEYLNNARFKKIVLDRFGSLKSFYEMLSDIKNYVDNVETNSGEDFNASKT